MTEVVKGKEHKNAIKNDNIIPLLLAQMGDSTFDFEKIAIFLSTAPQNLPRIVTTEFINGLSADNAVVLEEKLRETDVGKSFLAGNPEIVDAFNDKKPSSLIGYTKEAGNYIEPKKALSR